jgi:hypothetical protein
MVEVNAGSHNTPDTEACPVKPGDRRRVQVCVRVRPETAKFIDNMGFNNRGRALDGIVSAIQRKEIQKMVDSGGEFKVRVIG